MKNIFLLSTIALLSTSAAQASYFQEHCSSADGSVTIATGHSDNRVRLTQRKYDSQGQISDVHYYLNDGVQTQELESKKLEEWSKTYCSHDTMYGWMEWKHVTYKKVVLSKRDGSSFINDTAGMSVDGKSITANLICEFKGNSEAACGPIPDPFDSK